MTSVARALQTKIMKRLCNAMGIDECNAMQRSCNGPEYALSCENGNRATQCNAVQRPNRTKARWLQRSSTSLRTGSVAPAARTTSG